MKRLLLILIISIFNILIAQSQSIKGTVMSTTHEPLLGASVLELGTQNGTVTDARGEFSLMLNNPSAFIVVSFTGFVADTLVADVSKAMHIVLAEKAEELEQVVVKGSSTFVDFSEIKHAEVITETELQKAACCNLSESFETNASVDVSYSDAITGTKTIKMLGLDGRYVQINRENIPNVRGLAGRYGLSFIPGTWVQSIDVGKGGGSVVNGYESMTGQINVELKKPENSEKLYLNTYANSFGRMEVNANHATDINEKWSTAILFHSNYFGSEIDKNKDGFMDLPKSRQINLMNRYKYLGERMVSQVGIHVMKDEKAGGQLGFGFDDDPAQSSQYGFSNQTSRVEVFGKTGLLFHNKPYKGWGFIYSGAYLQMDGGFGRDEYQGNETTLYANTIFQNIIGNTTHQYKTGVSLLYDRFEESYADSLFSRKEVVPGAYFEYTYLPSDKFKLLLGSRVDFHNLYGTYFSPRVHARYQLGEKTALRMAVGKGYRTPNVLIENTNMLVSSRRLVVEGNPRPEQVWNVGGSLVTCLEEVLADIDLTVDYFYTHFENQLVYDVDQSPSEVRVYNLRGSSYAHSFQLEAKAHVSDYCSVKTAYKYYDVKSTINGQLRQVPFISKNRLFFNANYATRFDKWEADATLQWYGSKRLPDTTGKPVEFRRVSNTPDYFVLNAQVSRGFRWGNIYLGSENLLNFRQNDPIIDAANPFGSNFDASLVWAPVAGRVIYAGFRYKIKRQKQ